ncbi:hypothetical protein LLZ88_00270 [Ureaplasma urealyticum]|uniref:hypothetical protein n=1 Tax=Ureaplasma urealyticum TaxID=2130 RepID=UPI001F36BB11|nr:hypothetical protein [Ureaplasma urealyticum]UIU15123.1 hypothetical protein LLZ88_00270 [Ureaplasma urealyticum]
MRKNKKLILKSLFLALATISVIIPIVTSCSRQTNIESNTKLKPLLASNGNIDQHYLSDFYFIDTYGMNTLDNSLLNKYKWTNLKINHQQSKPQLTKQIHDWTNYAKQNDSQRQKIDQAIQNLNQYPNWFNATTSKTLSNFNIAKNEALSNFVFSTDKISYKNYTPFSVDFQTGGGALLGIVNNDDTNPIFYVLTSNKNIVNHPFLENQDYLFKFMNQDQIYSGVGKVKVYELAKQQKQILNGFSILAFSLNTKTLKPMNEHANTNPFNTSMLPYVNKLGLINHVNTKIDLKAMQNQDVIMYVNELSNSTISFANAPKNNDFVLTPSSVNTINNKGVGLYALFYETNLVNNQPTYVLTPILIGILEGNSTNQNDQINNLNLAINFSLLNNQYLIKLINHVKQQDVNFAKLFNN